MIDLCLWVVFLVQVLYCFVDKMDFTGMFFDEAIRAFLMAFRLPGEAQQIDRIMEKFAEKYYRDNSSVFAAPDVAYALAYSVIMLQTDLHNPNLKNKVLFSRSLQGCIDSGSCCP